MANSLFIQRDVEDLTSRAMLLHAHSARQWGTMTATEMLTHCNLVNKNVLESSPDHRKTTFKKALFKLLFLYVIPHFPRNRRGPARLQTKGLVNEREFESTKTEFISLLQRFLLHKHEIILLHPVFGKLTTKEWGLAMYKHVDHHLRQFGV